MKLRSIGLLQIAFVLQLTPLLRAQSPDVGQAKQNPVTAWCAAHMESLEQLYRHFHRHPELSFQEEKTAARLASEYRSLQGAQVSTDVGGHGVVAVIPNGEGPTVMLRTDLDALPVVEATNLIYSSRVKATNEAGVEVGVMHACGHDVHMTSHIGAARYLCEHRDAWRGTLMLIGQPAEERGAGARAMLKDGLFQRFPKPDAALALHVAPNFPAGAISFRSGYQQANVDSVDIQVNGRGGHGAAPHTTVDPIVQAAELILSLQTIVSREIQPTEPAVITVGSIHGGAKHNVIADSCHLQLTVRSYAREVRTTLLEAIKRKAEAVAKAHGAPAPDVQISEGTPSLFNDEQLAASLRPVFEAELGKAFVGQSPRSMGGEDFSRYGLAGVPILMIHLGSVSKSRLDRYKSLEQSPPSLHSALYYPDVPETLTTGIRSLAVAVKHLMPVKSHP